MLDQLTPLELDIFFELQECGEASFEQLETIAHSYTRGGVSGHNIIRSVISKLRRKVELYGFIINNDRGYGYRMEVRKCRKQLNKETGAA